MKVKLPINEYKYLIEIIVICILISIGAMWVAPGPLFPLIMKDFGVNNSIVGFTTSIVPLVMAVSSLLSGFLIGRIGLKWTFAIGAFLLSVNLLTPWTSNVIQLIVVRLVYAVGVAMTFPLVNGIMMQWFKPKEIPLLNGINMSAASLGNTIGMFATVGFATAWDWKWALAVYGIFALFMAILWIALGKECISSISGVVETGVPRVNMGSIIKRKETIIMGVCAAGPFLAYNGLMSWLPTYYNENFSLSLSDAGFIAGMGNLFAVPVCIIGSLMIMKTGLRKPFIIVPGILIGFAALMSFLVNNVVLLYVSIAVFGMSFFIFQPAIMTLAMELPGMTPQRATIVIAIAWAIGNFAGFFGPLIIGLLKDMSGSYLPGLLVCSILSLSLFIGGFFLPETGSRARRRD